jgi:hypothetical protein
MDKIGDGTRLNPFRPNISNAVSFVCNEVNGRFLVGTNEVLIETLVVDLQSFCNDNGMTYSDVLKWFVGDTP